MMYSRQLFDSLRFKVGIGIVLPLALILGLFSHLQYTRHRELEISLLEQWATDLGQTVEGGLRHDMLEQDFPGIQQIIDDVADRGGVENTFLINTQSEIRFAPRGKGVGTRLSLTDPGCWSCHRQEKQHLKNSAVVTTATGKRVLRNCNPVENEPACTPCHNPESRLNGVIITDLSMTEVDHHFGENLRGTLLLFGGALIAGVLTVNLAMNRLVVSRLARFAQAIKALGHGDLGQRVAMRGNDEIAQLAEMFNQMAQGLQEKAGLEQKVRKQADELRRLSEERGHLLEKTITAQEEERKRIARELHDEWAQTLAALTVNLDEASRALPDEMASQKHQLNRTHAVAVEALKALRQLILDLRPSMLDDLGLVPAIRWYAESHLEASGMAVDFRVTGSQRRLSPEIETALFRIPQEAINNIEKHAYAKEAVIHLEYQTDRVSMSIQDDGQGFDVDQVLRSGGKSRGLGLLGMRERTALLGGSLQIESQPGCGTRIRIQIPVGNGTPSYE
ncbi:MAG: ATP-binding protein [Anaerolineae bacterium]